VMHRYPGLWQVKAREDARLVKAPASKIQGTGAAASREAALMAWRQVAKTLEASGKDEDRKLARSIQTFVAGFTQQPVREPTPDRGRT
jgi:hypothetical protein